MKDGFRLSVCRRAVRGLPVGVAAVSLLLLSLAGGLRAQSSASDPPIQGFHPIGDFVLDIDEKPVSHAEFFLAEHRPAVLVVTPQLRQAVVLFPGDQWVRTVPVANLTRLPDGSVDLSLDSAIDQGKLQILASWVRFSVDGHQVTLKERPWLLGVQEIPNMESDNPEYVWRSSRYTPNPQIIQALVNQSAEVKVRVYFGSWCPFCRRHVPLMMKVDEVLSGSSSHIDIDYYGLPRGWSGHPVASPLKIKSVPTGIVYVDGKEVGRIENGDQWQAPELALKDILLR